MPPEITGQRFTSKIQTWWDTTPPGSGTGALTFDLVRGALNELPLAVRPSDFCAARNTSNLTIADVTVPAPANGMFYMVRGRNVCGVGTYGAATNGAVRTATICP